MFLKTAALAWKTPPPGSSSYVWLQPNQAALVEHAANRQ